MTSEVAWALLGLLIERPGYGGQLKQRMEREYGESIMLQSEGHIYRALDALEKRGWIEKAGDGAAVARGTERSPRIHYVPTPDGLRAFTDHVTVGMAEDRRQSMLFIRQFAALAVVDPSLGLEMLDAFSSQCAKQTRLAGSPARGHDAGGLGGELAARLVAEDTRLVSESKVRWIDYARRVLEPYREQL